MTPAPGELAVTRAADGVSFWIHVSPRARRASVGGRREDALRQLAAAPGLE